MTILLVYLTVHITLSFKIGFLGPPCELWGTITSHWELQPGGERLTSERAIGGLVGRTPSYRGSSLGSNRNISIKNSQYATQGKMWPIHSYPHKILKKEKNWKREHSCVLLQTGFYARIYCKGRAWARICELLRSPGIDSASLCSHGGQDIGLTYWPTYIGLAESIPGLLKSMQIRSLVFPSWQMA